MMQSSVQIITAGVLLLTGLTSISASFAARDPPPQQLREAQAACVKYLGICENRLVQYNNSIYPLDHDTMCMVRCAGIIVGFWDDNQGFKLEGLLNLFPELATDERVQQQILSCAVQRIAACPPTDTCAKAYNGFRCFLESQKTGFVVKENLPEQPAPVFNVQEFIRSLSICGKILRIPKNLQDLYHQGVFPNDEKTRSLIRCVGIRNELYDDVLGPNIPQLHKLFGAGQLEAEFRRKAEICINANQPLLDPKDKNAQAYGKLYRCFIQYRPPPTMERDRRTNVVAAAALLVVLSLALTLHVAEANIFGGKRFLKAQQDCVHFLGINPLRMGQYKKFVYPGDRETMCMIRCIGITLDFWDDILGFNVSLVEDQFSPLVNATFKKQLADNIALKLELLDPLDSCSRAFYAFRTFRAMLRQQLNGTVTPVPDVNFVPLQPVQILNIIVDCAREVKLPDAFLTSLSKGIIVDCPEMRCLIRCAAMRSKLYTDQDGALLANLHRQFEPPGEDLASFELRQNMCLQRNQQPATADNCTRAFRQFFACLRPDFEQYFIRNKESVLQHPIFKSEQLSECQASLLAQQTSPQTQTNAGMDPLGGMSGNLGLLLSSY
uniref:Uncharacterized protein n=1 Tax=Anopheles stephensi TaxID=30069 RepID=A0A182XWJ5_ANOST